jgi:hypothetical protein
MFVLYQPEQFHLLNDAFALGASPFAFLTTPDIRAQKLFFRGPPSGCGAFKFDPVSLFSLARPLAVNPAP